MADEVLVERLKHYEALLQEKGVDSSQTAPSSVIEHRPKSSHSELSETQWHHPAASGPQATIFEPKLLQGPNGNTKFVDK